MKKSPYTLTLLFISTVYLFSQTKGSDIIKVDTIIKIDTMIIIEEVVNDTVVLSEPTNKQDEQTDLSKYYFYKDYLSSLKPKDTLVMNDDNLSSFKKTDSTKRAMKMLLAEGGVLSNDYSAPYASLSITFSISKRLHFVPSYFLIMDKTVSIHFLSLMLGYYLTPNYESNKNLIVEGSVGIAGGGIGILLFPVNLRVYYKLSNCVLPYAIIESYFDFWQSPTKGTIKGFALGVGITY